MSDNKIYAPAVSVAMQGLGTRFGTVELRVEADLESVSALQGERDALWTRLDAASFLTDEEKRRMAGVGD